MLPAPHADSPAVRFPVPFFRYSCFCFGCPSSTSLCPSLPTGALLPLCCRFIIAFSPALVCDSRSHVSSSLLKLPLALLAYCRLCCLGSWLLISRSSAGFLASFVQPTSPRLLLLRSASFCFWSFEHSGLLPFILRSDSKANGLLLAGLDSCSCGLFFAGEF